MLGALRHHRQHDPQEAVDAHLREHGGEQREHRDRGGAVGLRHPAVQREERRLDEEGEREQQHDPVLRALRDRALLEHGERERDLAAVRRGEHAERDRRAEHQQRADQRVDHELRRRAHAVARSPAADQEVERHQHQVEEDDEERQILGQEGAQHRGLGERHPEVEEPLALVLAEGSDERAGHPGERRQHDHEQVEAVDPELVADAELGDPLVVGDVLEPIGARVEVGEQHDRVGEHRDRAGERGPARHPARQQGPDEAGEQRQEQDDRKVDRHELAMRK